MAQICFISSFHAYLANLAGKEDQEGLHGYRLPRHVRGLVLG